MKKYDGPIMLNAIGIGWAGPLILDIGSEEEKKKYIKGMLNAEDIWCQGFSEPENGSDLGNAQLKAVRDGDEYVLNGSKIWTSLGDRAKYMILLARTSNEGPSKYAGLSFFLSPMHAPGIEDAADQEAHRRIWLRPVLLHRCPHFRRMPDGQRGRRLADRDEDAGI
jgi:alkylation response protein AidB-like acyl-CoA dehydrogenase